MKISDLLNERQITTRLAGATKEDVIRELIDLLVKEKLVVDARMALKTIMDRERQQSTGIGRGLAIPHGKSGTVKHICAAMGISQNGIDYDSLDGEPVHVVFLLLAEEGKPGEHVMALAQIATLCKVPGFIDRLVASKTPKELYGVIVAEEEKEA